MDRRTFVGGLGTASALVTGSLARAASGIPARAPNIIFILADDMGYADVGAYGLRHLDTPHLDMLARDGLNLLQGYANSAICSATRTALATGCYQQRFAVGLEEPMGAAAPQDTGNPHDRPTIASVMRDRGYRTALVGKWHLWDPPHHSPLQHGYDRYFGLIQGAADYFRHRVDLSGEAPVDGLYRDDRKVDEPGYLTDLFGDEAVRIIRESSDKPLFLSLHFNAPHWPWEGPHDQEVSRNLNDIFHWNGGSLETYAKMVASMDENVGKVMAALDELGIADDTIVVFTSDNGGERFSDVWPFTGMKGELLEGGLRVPLLMRWPARVKARGISDQVMISMDILPTLLAAAGGESGNRRTIRRREPSACIAWRCGSSLAHPLLALQGQRAGSRPARRLEVSQARRQGASFQSGVGCARACRPQGRRAGEIRRVEKPLCGLERKDAPLSRQELQRAGEGSVP